MSPASQGNLEVERYIGSCLISTRARNGGSPAQGGHKGKKQSSDGIPKGKFSNSPRPVAHRGCPSDHLSHVRTGGYLPICDCGSFKFNRYGTSGRHTGGNWTGMPLISMAQNPRKNRKATTNSNVNGNRNPKNNSSHQDIALANVRDPTSSTQRTPFSRLAIHTQGVPLILSGRYNSCGRKTGNTNKNGAPARQGKNCEQANKKCVADGNDSVNTGNNTNNNNTPSNSDNLSVASDESSGGHSENCLPRIIKPRKRRKKDRKPPLITPVSPVSQENLISESNHDINTNLVTLKPYIPLCYELYDNRGQWRANRWFSITATVDTPVDTLRHWQLDKRSCTLLPTVFTPPVEEEQISDEDNHEPNLHHSFDDVKEDSSGSNLFPCIPSVCQCRYCDPSGLIWDVDQHRYSPFLTRPSLSESLDRVFGSVPVFTTPPIESPTLDFYEKSLSSLASNSCEESSPAILRRSWSDPVTSRRSRDVFGIVDSSPGTGNFDSYENSSQSLEFSTEIVTSPNGHRDIEIKFYSSSPPNRSSRSSPRSDKCSESEYRRTRTSTSSSSDGDSSVDIWKSDNYENDNRDVWNGSVLYKDPCNANLNNDITNNYSTKSLRHEVNQLCLHAEE